MTLRPTKKSPKPSTHQDGFSTRVEDQEHLSSSLGHHLRRAHLALWRDFNEDVGKGGLRPGELGVMNTIHRHPGISQKAVGETLDLDKATIVGLVNKLEKNKWAKRKQSKEDRRQYELHLTKSGERKLNTYNKSLSKLESQYRERFTETEFEQFIDYLRRLFDQ
ncbi:MarR family winged helix-turn-helix transcriptional regulator [Aurantivibrio plasticivorans]